MVISGFMRSLLRLARSVALARLRGLEGFSDLRSLSINELAEKVFTTEAAWTSRLWRFWLVLVALCEFEPSQHDRRHTNRGVEMG
jgi:hypothetical protein